MRICPNEPRQHCAELVIQLLVLWRWDYERRRIPPSLPMPVRMGLLSSHEMLISLHPNISHPMQVLFSSRSLEYRDALWLIPLWRPSLHSKDKTSPTRCISWPLMDFT